MCPLNQNLKTFSESWIKFFWSLTITLLWIPQQKNRIISYHQLGEHAVQLIISWHRQWRLHGLQGEVLSQPVGDLRVIAAVKTAEDEGEATTATAAAFPGSHGCLMSAAVRVGRVGGSFRASLQPPPPQSLASVREYCRHREGTQWVFPHKDKTSLSQAEGRSCFLKWHSQKSITEERVFSEVDEQ